MKKQSVRTIGLFLLIPVVTVLGGLLFSLINPEIAAGHPNYLLNYQLLNLLKISCLFGSFAVVGLLWILVCLQVIRSRKRSYLWLILAALGPVGFACLAALQDHTTAETDSYTRLMRKMHWFVRAGYEVLSFVVIWELAWQAMLLKGTLMIWYEAYATGVSTAQIVDLQNASSGMWAFGEGMEVMYLAVLLYLLRPFVFRIAAHLASNWSSPQPH